MTEETAFVTDDAVLVRAHRGLAPPWNEFPPEDTS